VEDPGSGGGSLRPGGSDYDCHVIRTLIAVSVIVALFVAMLLVGIPLSVALPLTALSVAIGLIVAWGPQGRRGQL
jgi:hypothetical protein